MSITEHSYSILQPLFHATFFEAHIYVEVWSFDLIITVAIWSPKTLSSLAKKLVSEQLK